MTPAKNCSSRIVVTGSSGGLGSHLVRHFADTGANVYAVDLANPQTRADGVHYVTADLGTAIGVTDTVALLSSELTALDVLVNCAGSFLPDITGREIWGTVDGLWKANVLSTIMLTLHLESLLAAGSSPLVVNVASTDGVVASGGQNCEIGVSHDVLYSTTKGAVITFTRALAMKWAQLGIRVNAVCPTVFPSPMTQSLLMVPGKIEELHRHIPLGRLATTQDVVDAITAIGKMRMTTGHLFPVDGGYLCQ